jgi:hypothetical protein
MDSAVDIGLRPFDFVGFFIVFSLYGIVHEAVAGTSLSNLRSDNKKAARNSAARSFQVVCLELHSISYARTLTHGAHLIHSFCWHHLAPISLLSLRGIP